MKFFSSKKNVFFLVTPVLLLGAIFTGSSMSIGTDNSADGHWLRTNGAVDRQNECTNGDICVEWCQRSCTGQIVPTKVYCCVPPGMVSSDNLYACSGPQVNMVPGQTCN